MATVDTYSTLKTTCRVGFYYYILFKVIIYNTDKLLFAYIVHIYGCPFYYISTIKTDII